MEGENKSRKRATNREYFGSSDVDGGLRFWRALKKGPAVSVSLRLLFYHFLGLTVSVNDLLNFLRKDLRMNFQVVTIGDILDWVFKPLPGVCTIRYLE